MERGDAVRRENVLVIVIAIDTTGEQQTGGVGRGVVGEADLEAVALQLVRVCRRENAIARDERVSNLSGDIAVRLINKEQN